MINVVKYCIATILIGLATAKLLQVTFTRELEKQVFLGLHFLPMSWVIIPVALAELATGLALLFAPLVAVTRPLAYLAAGFTAYRVAALFQEETKPCDCLGGLGKLLGIGNHWLNIVSWITYAVFMILVIILFAQDNLKKMESCDEA